LHKRLWLWTVQIAMFALVPALTNSASAPKSTPAGPSAGQAGAWEQEWEKTLAAAKREGTVVVFGPPGERSRRAFAHEFKKAFPAISVEYSGGWGPAHAPKILEARKAGRYLGDIFISGPQPGLSALKDSGMMQALMPALILPEVKDPKKWRLGKLDFIDKERRYYLAFWAYPSGPFVYNTKEVDPAEIKSWWDVVKPKFKGKVVMYDPLVPGSMIPKLNFFFHTPELGEKYIRTLLDPAFASVVTRDDRQLAEWVGRGNYWIGIAASWLTAAPLTEVLPLKMFPAGNLKEGDSLTSGFGNIAILTGAPNPNASKIYANWLLSREGQTAITPVLEQASGRVDVPQESVPSPFRRNPGMRLFAEYHEEVVAGREKATAVAKQVLGR
jgi:iron(III) transport system substrate-binding protein